MVKAILIAFLFIAGTFLFSALFSGIFWGVFFKYITKVEVENERFSDIRE